MTNFVKCGGRQNYISFFRCCYPCHLPSGHGGDYHQAEDGTFPVGQELKNESDCDHDLIDCNERCCWCGKLLS